MQEVESGDFFNTAQVDHHRFAFTEFGIAQISVDFVLGTAGTNIQGKVREVLRAVEDNLLGESMSGVHALVSREFFDKLISHPKTEEAYKFYAATGAQPLRQDVRRNFPFAGILFEEYAGAVTLSTKASERLVPANEGIAFPTGTVVPVSQFSAHTHRVPSLSTKYVVFIVVAPAGVWTRTSPRTVLSLSELRSLLSSRRKDNAMESILSPAQRKKSLAIAGSPTVLANGFWKSPERFSLAME